MNFLRFLRCLVRFSHLIGATTLTPQFPTRSISITLEALSRGIGVQIDKDLIPGYALFEYHELSCFRLKPGDSNLVSDSTEISILSHLRGIC